MLIVKLFNLCVLIMDFDEVTFPHEKRMGIYFLRNVLTSKPSRHTLSLNHTEFNIIDLIETMIKGPFMRSEELHSTRL